MQPESTVTWFGPTNALSVATYYDRNGRRLTLPAALFYGDKITVVVDGPHRLD